MLQNQEHKLYNAKMSKTKNITTVILHIEHLKSMAGENKD